ncbi:unnamed protein product [Rotaria magnacalcarata]|uniref:RNA-dependent RNA polymerase n=1 Tax=Rotaria magnacalcarata TaxID=392030 RepID=A0A816HCG2_9BILA|nr:unnamed protein product [Rotaria magnacalcarata]
MSDNLSSSLCAQLSIIVDLSSSSFDFKKLYSHLSSQSPPNTDHHHWYFGGLRSFTIPFEANHDEITINHVISKLKLLQNHLSILPPFWISYKKCQPLQQQPAPFTPATTPEVIRKNIKLGKFYANNGFDMEYTGGALVGIDKYIWDIQTQIRDPWRLVFYHDKIEIDYGSKEKRLRKTLKAEVMDRCAVIMTQSDGFTLFINMNGNPIDHEAVNSTKSHNTNDDEIDPILRKIIESNISYTRTAPRESQPFYSTIRLSISLSNSFDYNNMIMNTTDEHRFEQLQRLNSCYTQFIDFFHRNYIYDCFGIITSIPSSIDFSSISSLFMSKETTSFIKQYCWQMLMSIGYRFQQRLTTDFIQQMNSIGDDDEFYQTSLHIWRRSSEYYFIDLLGELRRYREKFVAETVFRPSSPASSINNHRQQGKKKDGNQQERWSIRTPPRNYAYVPSVTLTPTTICVNPFKLVKTNRVLRESKFGGNLMFALVDVKDENGKMDLFPHDYRALRWKTEMLLESGFDLGAKGRTYRYLHHSQSQLKDKQFWFYHNDSETNFSFEEAFAWMGDFQEEQIVAKHAARIAQCFTSAEATIQIPSEKVEYIEDIHTDDNKYNFTDGVGTMSTIIRDNINPYRQFSAIQIRYGGCKGVISVNPDLDNSPHQLRIRQSMRKFKCSHDILELCRISKPRPLYLNRQIIVLLSHREIDDRTFLLLQHQHQQYLSESLVYPTRAYELLAEKINRSLFPLRTLVNAAHLNLIQEPFFRQLIITTSKFELAQMRERTRLKLPKNSARNMIGIVDEYGVLEYGQVFVQYTELHGETLDDELGSSNDSSITPQSEKAVILEQKVVVTKNPCHHPGDIRIFEAVDVPRLRHLKDVIVFPQRGKRPHPNEISGSDLDGDEYAVLWHPEFIPKTPNNTPYDYDSQTPMLRVVNRPVSRADIQATVLDISEQSCVGKLCSLHLANSDLHGVAHPKTLAIAGYISEELDAPKTGQHPLTPRQIAHLQSELGNERPDYFDKPCYKLYPSKHVLGQLFRSCLRFEPNWTIIQTPPTTVSSTPIDPLLVHDLHVDYTTSVEEIARVYREAIMDIMYVYRFSSDVDLLCRFDSSSSQHKTPLTKQQTDSACLIADSAQVELKQLIRRVRRLFYHEFRFCDKTHSIRCQTNCMKCADKKMAKASALYILCYTDTRHARRMLSLPWLFASLLIETRKLNIKKQTKLLSPKLVAQMLEIQPYQLIGQSLRRALQHLFDQSKPLYFHHSYSHDNSNLITVSLGPTSTAKRLLLKRQILLLDYFILEVLHHFVYESLSKERSPITAAKPLLLESVWQHIMTRFILGECSPLVLITSKSTTVSINKDFQCWSDEQACKTLQRVIDISVQCAEHGPDSTNYAHANEYLVSTLQQMATTGSLFST